jgi:hypothetical protein
MDSSTFKEFYYPHLQCGRESLFIGTHPPTYTASYPKDHNHKYHVESPIKREFFFHISEELAAPFFMVIVTKKNTSEILHRKYNKLIGQKYYH